MNLNNPYNARTFITVEKEGRLTAFRVEVVGEYPNDFSRVYILQYRTAEEASLEALFQFTAEINRLMENSHESSQT
jgi:hypothetical protein